MTPHGVQAPDQAPGRPLQSLRLADPLTTGSLRGDRRALPPRVLRAWPLPAPDSKGPEPLMRVLEWGEGAEGWDHLWGEDRPPAPKGNTGPSVGCQPQSPRGRSASSLEVKPARSLPILLPVGLHPTTRTRVRCPPRTLSLWPPAACLSHQSSSPSLTFPSC